MYSDAVASESSPHTFTEREHHPEQLLLFGGLCLVGASVHHVVEIVMAACPGEKPFNGLSALSVFLQLVLGLTEFSGFYLTFHSLDDLDSRLLSPLPTPYPHINATHSTNRPTMSPEDFHNAAGRYLNFANIGLYIALTAGILDILKMTARLSIQACRMFNEWNSNADNSTVPLLMGQHSANRK